MDDPQPPDPPGRSVTRLTDPRALRALAHPLRISLVGLLRREGPLTATRAGELLGESSGSCSFHLRQLAKYGLVEEAGGGRGRNGPGRRPRCSRTCPTWPKSPSSRRPRACSARFLRNATSSS